MVAAAIKLSNQAGIHGSGGNGFVGQRGQPGLPYRCFKPRQRPNPGVAILRPSNACKLCRDGGLMGHDERKEGFQYAITNSATVPLMLPDKLCNAETCGIGVGQPG